MAELGLGWTHATIIRLVEEYKNKPELWDPTHDSYRMQTAKYEAWLALAAIFNCDIADLRRKMNSILASLRREKMKVRCGGRSTWFLYDHLRFLPRHEPNNLVAFANYKRGKNVEAEETDQSDNENADTITHEEDEEDEENEAQEEQELIYIKEEPTTTSFDKTTNYPRQIVNKPRLIRRIRKKPVVTSNRLDGKILETLKLIRRSGLVKKKDECDSFGEYIANSLRKHDERTRSMVKQAINNILFEQEMKKYGSESYVLITADDNPLLLEDSSK